MVSFSVLSLAVATIATRSLATANPLPEGSASSTYSLRTVRNANNAGLAQHARGLAKYGGTIPEGLTHLLPRQQVTGKCSCS